jgi:uncharacterized HAD superfamily protein
VVLCSRVDEPYRFVTESRAIYVDLDDVLCDAARHFLAVVEREFGRRVAFEQLTDFDVGLACGLRPAERDALYRIVHEPDQLLQMSPVREAIALLGDWTDQGYEIAIVTGRPPASREASLAWLERHRVPHHSFTQVDKYGRFSRADAAAGALALETLAARRYCWAVEDSWPMARFLAERMQVPVALLDAPWNRAGPLANVQRFRDWSAIARGPQAAAARRGLGLSSRPS